MEYRRDYDNEETEKARDNEMNLYSKPAKKSNPPSKSCHYCGCEATDFDFFGEPVCDDCK